MRVLIVLFMSTSSMRLQDCLIGVTAVWRAKKEFACLHIYCLHDF